MSGKHTFRTQRYDDVDRQQYWGSPVPPVNYQYLLSQVQAGVSLDYLFFWGHRQPTDGVVTKSCFSQWYSAAFRIDNEIFKTAEHYMMVRKARLFGDDDSARSILKATTPNEAKSIGRKVRGFHDQIWEEQREDIVFSGNLAKFSQHSALRRFLLETGDAILVEASPVDTIWGIGLAQDNPLARDPFSWLGLNLLGFALMRVRTHLRDHKTG